MMIIFFKKNLFCKNFLNDSFHSSLILFFTMILLKMGNLIDIRSNINEIFHITENRT